MLRGGWLLVPATLPDATCRPAGELLDTFSTRSRGEVAALVEDCSGSYEVHQLGSLIRGFGRGEVLGYLGPVVFLHQGRIVTVLAEQWSLQASVLISTWQANGDELVTYQGNVQPLLLHVANELITVGYGATDDVAMEVSSQVFLGLLILLAILRFGFKRLQADFEGIGHHLSKAEVVIHHTDKGVEELNVFAPGGCMFSCCVLTNSVLATRKCSSRFPLSRCATQNQHSSYLPSDQVGM